MSIVEFLEARIADDEEDSNTVHNWDCMRLDQADGWCTCTQPLRQLAECKAKRVIIAKYQAIAGEGGDSAFWFEDKADDMLRALARVYADHPDFDPAWATVNR